MTNIYVAGPMRGKPFFNQKQFCAFTKVLRGYGFKVFNPSEHDTDVLGVDLGMYHTGNEVIPGFDIRKALAADLKFITEQADAVCVLEGWEDSTGARAEVATARALGLPVGPLKAFDSEARIFESDCIPSSYKPSHPTVAPLLKTSSLGPLLSGTWPTQPYPVEWETKEVRTVSSTGGEKGVKPQRYDLIPIEPLNKLAELYGAGAAKYSSHNWRRGYEWSNSYAAAQRHMTQFWNGEDIDPEMGTPHVINAVFHMFALAQFMQDFPNFDDRFKK
jgi:hypothetical protein